MKQQVHLGEGQETPLTEREAGVCQQDSNQELIKIAAFQLDDVCLKHPE